MAHNALLGRRLVPLWLNVLDGMLMVLSRAAHQRGHCVRSLLTSGVNTF